MKITRNIAGLKATAKAEIDRRAEDIRQSFLTAGDAQQLVYAYKRERALQIIQIVEGGGTPDPNQFPLVAADAEVFGSTLVEAATDILTAAENFERIGSVIEVMRLGAKLQVENAETPNSISEQVEEVTQAKLAQRLAELGLDGVANPNLT